MIASYCCNILHIVMVVYIVLVTVHIVVLVQIVLVVVHIVIAVHFVTVVHLSCNYFILYFYESNFSYCALGRYLQESEHPRP